MGYPRGTRGIDPGRVPRFPTGILGYPEVLWQLLRDTPEIPKGYQVAKAKSKFSCSTWDNKSRPGRRTVCLECEQQQTDAPVHKCDACQVLLLGPRIASRSLGIRVRYPRGTRGINPGKVPRFPIGILGYPEVITSGRTLWVTRGH